jgi:hypothetical protein
MGLGSKERRKCALLDNERKERGSEVGAMHKGYDEKRICTTVQ